jgi:hypothetical protein
VTPFQWTPVPHDVDFLHMAVKRWAKRKLGYEHVARLKVLAARGSLVQVRLLDGGFGLGFLVTETRRDLTHTLMINFLAASSQNSGTSRRSSALLGFDEEMSPVLLTQFCRPGKVLYVHNPTIPDIHKAKTAQTETSAWLLPQGGGDFPQIRGRNW